MQTNKYFVYVRVSNDEYSIDNQIEMCKALAEQHNIAQENLIVMEETVTGSGSKVRKKFDEMMGLFDADIIKPISNRVYGGILFFKIDRLARNHEDFNQIEKIFNNGYKLVSYTETIENTPTGKLLFRILSSFAIYESEKLSNRMSISTIIRAISKEFASIGGNKLPFGYERKDDKTLKINDSHRNLILRIYDLYVGIDGDKDMQFKEIVDRIERENPGVIGNFIREMGNETVPRKFVRNIIADDGMYRYNGTVVIKIAIKDELVENYLLTIQEKYYEDMDINGSNGVGEDIEFVFYEDELCIVPEILYMQVRDKIQSKKRNDTKKGDYKGIFNGYIYYGSSDGEKAISSYIGTKGYWSYRISIGGTNREMSEKKIEKLIGQMKFIQDLKPLTLDQKGILNHQLLNFLISQDDSLRRKHQCRINQLKALVEKYQYILDEEKDISEIERLVIAKRATEDRVDRYQNEVSSISKKRDAKILNFIASCNFSKNIKSKSDVIKRSSYIVLFDRIVYNPNKTITFFIQGWIADLLGLKREYVANID